MLLDSAPTQTQAHSHVQAELKTYCMYPYRPILRWGVGVQYKSRGRGDGLQYFYHSYQSPSWSNPHTARDKSVVCGCPMRFFSVYIFLPARYTQAVLFCNMYMYTGHTHLVQCSTTLAHCSSYSCVGNERGSSLPAAGKT